MLEALESIFCFIRNFQIGNYYEVVSLQLQNMCIYDNNLLPALTFSSSNLESMHRRIYNTPLIIIYDNHMFPFINTSFSIVISSVLFFLLINNKDPFQYQWRKSAFLAANLIQGVGDGSFAFGCNAPY